jgi:hypothetical protein
MFDDTSVTAVNWDYVKRHSFGKAKPEYTAHVLGYQKQ